jgi:hypothetical protein
VDPLNFRGPLLKLDVIGGEKLAIGYDLGCGM